MLARHTKWVKKFSRYGARWALGLLLTVLALLEVNGTLQSDAIERFDNFLVGTRMRLTPAQHDPRIVIVDIDEKSLARVGRFPWSRDVVARLVGQLTTHYEVNVVGFDVAFPEPDTSSGYGVLARLAEMSKDWHSIMAA